MFCLMYFVVSFIFVGFNFRGLTDTGINYNTRLHLYAESSAVCRHWEVVQINIKSKSTVFCLTQLIAGHNNVLGSIRLDLLLATCSSGFLDEGGYTGYKPTNS
jgi:hypothetical protein